MLGIGGALVTAPLLWFALPCLGFGHAANLAHVVIASSLAAMLPTGIAAALSQHRRGHLDLAWLARMAPAMVVGAVAGAAFAASLRGTVLVVAFAGQTLYYGCRLLSLGPVDPGERPPGVFARAASRLPFPLVGVGMAGFCACVGMGGGSMVVPYLMSRGLAFRRTIATSGTLNLCVAFGGSIAFCLAKDPAGHAMALPAWGPALVIGGVASLAAPIGVALAARLPSARLGLGVGLVNVCGALAVLAQAL
jgi:hypothetical protein